MPSRIKKRILIDLDGVLNLYGNVPYDENFIPKVKKGARGFLRRLNSKYELIIFTSRPLLLTSKWIIENKLDKYIKEATNTKLPAYLYIDDRAVQFKGDYNETLKEIQNFKVHWKKDK